jgi:putative ABC transport system substrate-binding protein
MHKLRHFIGSILAAILLFPSITCAQQAPKTPARVAVLSPQSPPEPGFEAFRAALRELGYAEGHDLVLEVRWARGLLERLPELATQLVSLKPHVIFAPGEQGLRAAKQSTTDTPIVTVACDPLDKLVMSLAHPGGSATGLSCVHSDLAGKRLQLLKEAMPRLAHAAILYNPSDPNKRSEFGQLEVAGRRLGVTVGAFEVADAAGIDAAFAAMAAQRAQAVVVLVDGFTIFHRRKLANLALERRLPMVSGFKEFAEAGGLLSYGANRSALFRRAAAYVDKILKGAKPGDLPVEEPTTFELCINQKTAKALELTIPTVVLDLADEIIE